MKVVVLLLVVFCSTLALAGPPSVLITYPDSNTQALMYLPVNVQYTVPGATSGTRLDFHAFDFTLQQHVNIISGLNPNEELEFNWLPHRMIASCHVQLYATLTGDSSGTSYGASESFTVGIRSPTPPCFP